MREYTSSVKPVPKSPFIPSTPPLKRTELQCMGHLQTSLCKTAPPPFHMKVQLPIHFQSIGAYCKFSTCSSTCVLHFYSMVTPVWFSPSLFNTLSFTGVMLPASSKCKCSLFKNDSKSITRCGKNLRGVYLHTKSNPYYHFVIATHLKT